MRPSRRSERMAAAVRRLAAAARRSRLARRAASEDGSASLEFLTLGVLLLVPLAYLVIFFLLPVGGMLYRGFFADGSLDLTGFADVLGSSRIRRLIWLTIAQATVASLISVLLGLPVAYCLYRLRFPGQGLLRAVVQNHIERGMQVIQCGDRVDVCLHIARQAGMQLHCSRAGPQRVGTYSQHSSELHQQIAFLVCKAQHRAARLQGVGVALPGGARQGMGDALR